MFVIVRDRMGAAMHDGTAPDAPQRLRSNVSVSASSQQQHDFGALCGLVYYGFGGS
ncbi:hypothetical protein WI665_10245 [Vibrio cholerae]